MKIGIFTDAYKPIVSGVVNSIESFRAGLTTLGHKVYIFAPDFPGYEDRPDGIFRFSSINIHPEIYFPVAIPFSPRLFSIIAKLDLDIIHTQHPFVIGEVGAFFARKLKIPLIYTLHTQYEQYSHYVPLNQRFVRALTRRVVKYYTSNCDCVITPASRIKELLVADYGINSSRIEVIPNAIDLSLYQNIDPELVKSRYSLNGGRKGLVFVGRLAREKNLSFLLYSFQNILRRRGDVYLMIVGGGPEEINLRNLAKELKIEKSTIFTGSLPYQQIPYYYAAADIFVTASTTEVHPLTLIEAMAAGLPIVAVNAFGTCDMVTPGEDGLLTANSSGNFEEGILTLLDNKGLRDEMSIKAKEKAQKYSIPYISKQLEKLYLSLLEN